MYVGKTLWQTTSCRRMAGSTPAMLLPRQPRRVEQLSRVAYHRWVKHLRLSYVLCMAGTRALVSAPLMNGCRAFQHILVVLQQTRCASLKMSIFDRFANTQSRLVTVLFLPNRMGETPLLS